MDNNDLLRRLRYALRCDDAQTAKLVRLGNGHASPAIAARWRAKESDGEFLACSSKTIAQFLDGLILDLRGPRETPASNPWPSKPANDKDQAAGVAENDSIDKQGSKSGNNDPQSDKPTQMDNNVVLKQLRIALSLRSDDVHAILKAGGSAMSDSEAGALFRKPSARNYRQCGDQVLRQFIAGLVARRQQQDES